MEPEKRPVQMFSTPKIKRFVTNLLNESRNKINESLAGA